MPGSVELSFMGWGEERLTECTVVGQYSMRKGSAKAT